VAALKCRCGRISCMPEGCGLAPFETVAGVPLLDGPTRQSYPFSNSSTSSNLTSNCLSLFSPLFCFGLNVRCSQFCSDERSLSVLFHPSADCPVLVLFSTGLLFRDYRSRSRDPFLNSSTSSRIWSFICFTPSCFGIKSLMKLRRRTGVDAVRSVLLTRRSRFAMANSCDSSPSGFVVVAVHKRTP